MKNVMDYMKQALSLARLALGQVSPNPAVGAVVVRGGEVVGQGYTQPPGSAHAEIVALQQAGEKAHGGVMYVTLEPCAHYGRTPPCTQAIIDGIAEVHMAMLDPNPLVAGRGEEVLQREDIRTYVGEHEEEARDVNEAYVKFISTGMPFVTAKFALSLDGDIATKSGDSKWISSSESRKYVHCLRYTTDAVMVGANTVIIDDPRLTCRYGGKGGTTRKQPLRVIIDGKGRIPPDARIFGEPGSILLAVRESIESEKKEAFIRAGAEVLELPLTKGMLDLRVLIKALGERNITGILVEGGGVLLGSLFDSGLVDKVVVFVAPIIIGGEKARTAIAGVGADKVKDAVHLERINVTQCGEDLMITGYVRR